MKLPRACRYAGMLGLVIAAALGIAERAETQTASAGGEPERIRGQIVQVDASGIVLKTPKGAMVRVRLPESAAVFALSKASFGELDFGTYVGAVSRKLGDDVYSPIVRDSLSWLHRGFELHLVDESLRGIAVGHTKWDLTEDSVMTHGWVDDLEERVISIKYGPTEEEETDVEVPRDIPVTRMSRADRSLVKAGAAVLVGAQKGADGAYNGLFIFIGKDGLVPAL